ncbi:hypothetical protein SAMN05444678_102188 [Sphingomonas sp. YR710]|nr:hypothetical protein SAMN05444678_102188 [Sphingomonas sp. YR710]
MTVQASLATVAPAKARMNDCKPLPFRGGVGVGHPRLTEISVGWEKRPHPNPSPEGEGLFHILTRFYAGMTAERIVA